MDEETVKKLFIEYKKTGDIATRNKIAEYYMSTAEIVAKSFSRRGVDFEDLRQIAYLSLINGIDRYDPYSGNKFTTFITPTIAGEIRNYFRDKYGLVKLPRKLNEIRTAVKKYVYEYEGVHGKKPTVTQIAEKLKYTEEEIQEAIEARNTVSLDGTATVNNEEDGDHSLYSLIPDTDDKYEQFETKDALNSVIKDLSDVEKTFIKYRFVEGKTQSQIAKILGVSQMYVSRMERRLLIVLKERLAESFSN